MAGADCIGPTCLPEYPNGEAPKECLLFWRGSYFSPYLFVRIVPAVLEFESDTSVLTIGQGYRFRGIPSDRALGSLPAAEFELNAGDTSTGDANQEYQKGREDAGFTPQAATPGTSPHGAYADLGAVDCYTDNEGRRDSVFPLYGLEQTISDESWHWAVAGESSRPLPTIGEAVILAALDCTPIPEPVEGGRRRTPTWFRRPATAYYRTW